MKRYLFLFFVLLMTPALVFPADPGTSGADILKVPIGVRPAALGGTYAALGDDVYVIGYNPAGLARVSKYSLGIDHIEGFAGVQVESLSAAIPTRDYGNFGGQFVYRHMPDISNALATDPVITANDILLIVADAQQFGKIAIGGSLKTIYSSLGEKQALTEAIDLGVKFQLFDTDIGVAGQNIGPPV